MKKILSITIVSILLLAIIVPQAVVAMQEEEVPYVAPTVLEEAVEDEEVEIPAEADIEETEIQEEAEVEKEEAEKPFGWGVTLKEHMKHDNLIDYDAYVLECEKKREDGYDVCNPGGFTEQILCPHCGRNIISLIQDRDREKNPEVYVEGDILEAEAYKKRVAEAEEYLEWIRAGSPLEPLPEVFTEEIMNEIIFGNHHYDIPEGGLKINAENFPMAKDVDE